MCVPGSFPSFGGYEDDCGLLEHLTPGDEVDEDDIIEYFFLTLLLRFRGRPGDKGKIGCADLPMLTCLSRLTGSRIMPLLSESLSLSAQPSHEALEPIIEFTSIFIGVISNIYRVSGIRSYKYLSQSPGLSDQDDLVTKHASSTSPRLAIAPNATLHRFIHEAPNGKFAIPI